MLDPARIAELERGGVPAAVLSAVTAPGFDARRQYAAAARRLGHGCRLLGLSGPPRLGKSCAAVLALAQAARNTRAVKVAMPCEPGAPGAYHVAYSAPQGRDPGPGAWFREEEVGLAPRLLRPTWLRAARSTGRLFDSKWWEAAAAAEALALDDLGAEPPEPQAGAQVADLICERFDRGSPTVITTNLDVGAFVARYGAGRLAGRLRETGAVWVAAPSEGGSI